MTTEDRPPSRRRFAWPSPRHWSLRVKFSVVLLVPMVLAVGLGIVRISDQIAVATERDRVARLVAAQGMVSALVVDVERERHRATEFVATGRADGRALQSVVEAVDQRAAQSHDVVEHLIRDIPELVLIERQADQALARLPPLRELVTRSNAPPSAVLERYSQLIESLVLLDTALLRHINTAEVSGLGNSLASLGMARSETTLQQAQMAIAVHDPPVPETLVRDLQFSDARLSTGLAQFRVALNPAQRVRYATLIAGSANSDRKELLQSVLAGAPPAGVGVPTVADVYGRFLGELDASAEGVRAELRNTAAEGRQDAITHAWLNVVLLLLALVLGAVIVGLIARGMIASLRTLRRSAITVAEERLPEAVRRMREGAVPNVNPNSVPVTTREEVGQVARAFDAVHIQAVKLAAEQAKLQNNINAMYVNLSRRSQALVDRQLMLIEQLEEGEDDPEQLADLFRLDHLATRMRRNCENLLVLAGADVPRTASEPTPVVDVLRAAVSEIEHYKRVVVQNPPDATFAGSAASDIQHLLAELLDNATNFSPPDSQVVMSCSRARDDSILVEIFDNGMGLPAGELAVLNERLRNPAEATATVAASRRMGLFVVGRLADRHGIWVGLFTDSMSSSGGSAGKNGVTARVTIPADLVGEPAPDSDPIVWSRPGTTPTATPTLPARVAVPPDADATPATTLGGGPRPGGPGDPVGADASAGTAETAAPEQNAGRQNPVTASSWPPPPRDPTSGDTTMQLPVVRADAAPPEPAPAPLTPPPSAPVVEPPVIPDSGPTDSDAGSLFEPLVPPLSLPDPDAPRPRDPLAATGDDDPAADTIFAEATSGWFQAIDPPTPPAGTEAATDGIPVAVTATLDRPAAHPVPPMDSEAFATDADSAWHAAEQATEGRTGGLTKAGLPKRVPRGRLVPGSIGGGTPPTISGRDPEAVRGRLTTFQRGVRDGRVKRPHEGGDDS